MSAPQRATTTGAMLADAEHRYLLALRMATATQSEPTWRDNLLRPEEFATPAIRTAAGVWGELAASGEYPIDADVVRVLVERGERDHAMRICDLVVDAPHDWDWIPSNLASAAALVRELSTRERREAVLKAAHESASKGRVVDVTDIRVRLEEAGRSPAELLPTYTQHKLVEMGTEDWLRRLESQGRPWHARLGIDALDHAMGGLDRGSLLVVGARTSAGKSALLLRAARGSAAHGLRMDILSLEDPPETWGTRELAASAELSASNLRKGGSLTPREAERMRAIDVHEMWRVTDCRARRDLGTLCTHMRRTVRERSLDIVAVDYIQLVRAKGTQDRRTEVETAVATLKGLAAELGVSLILAAQLRRHDGPPTLEVLKEAGALEEQAEVVLLMHRVRKPDSGDDVFVEIAKSKSGTAGKVFRVGWDARSAAFLEAYEMPDGWNSVVGKSGRGGKVREPGGYARQPASTGRFTRAVEPPDDFSDE